MLPDRVSNPGPLTYESGALPIALRGPAFLDQRPVKEDSATMPMLVVVLWFYVHGKHLRSCRDGQ